MFYLLYNLLVIIFIVFYFPVHLVRILFFPKHRNSTLPRLGFQKIPCYNKEEEVYWFHTVSVGETKAIKGLVKKIKLNEPNSKIVISTITETGQKEAQQIEDVDATFYYPVDFYFLIKKMVMSIKPKYLIIVETDLWANLLQQCFKFKTKIYLVNGKLSEKSQKRYSFFTPFFRLVFDPFYHIFSQTETYTKRFIESGFPKEKISTVGNLKLDIYPKKSTEAECNERLEYYGLDSAKPLVIFASTHNEEENIAIELYNNSDIQLVLAPRHPERFKKVRRLLDKKIKNYNKFSDYKGESLEKKGLLLLDTLGKLMEFYEIADLAIVAGSFTKKVGGHNIFEPAFYKKPFIYGKYLYKQPGLKQLASDYNAGVETSVDDLIKVVNNILKDENKLINLGEAGYKAILSSQGLTEKVYNNIKNNLD